ncbi:MFS transporter [Rhizobium sp. NXC14]|uniref:MFS transporter n=1 Tax=Rhizobium sp. NXC14 TaxID=1981173 RepID=UPI001FDA4B93|nr:MFS transporter [Rhizobium sp. NXC14]
MQISGHFNLTATNTVRSIGPALGGIIVAVFGPLVTVAITTFGFVAPLTALWRNKWKGQMSPLPREALTTAIYDGLRFTAISSEIKATIVRGTLFGLAGTSMLALLPLVARDLLKGGPIDYGILMGGFGAGALVAGFANPSLRRTCTQELLIVLACTACAACALALSLTSSLFVATACLASGGAGCVTGWSGFGVNVQLASPRWVVGRTISIYSAFTYGGITAGSWLWGAIAENHSLSMALACSAAASLAVAVLWAQAADQQPPGVGTRCLRRFRCASAGTRSEAEKRPNSGDDGICDFRRECRSLS